MPVPSPLDAAGGHTGRVMIKGYLMDDKDSRTGTAAATIDGQSYRARFRVKEDGTFEILGKTPTYDLGPAAARVSGRGAARGLFSTVAGIPWYLPQWAGEKGVDYGGRALNALFPDNVFDAPEDWGYQPPGKGPGFPGALGESLRTFSSERQHDNLQRFRMGERLKAQGFGPEEIARAMAGGSESARAMTRMPELEAREAAGATDEDIARAMAPRGWKDTNRDYQRVGARSGFLDPESPWRSLDKGTEAMLEKMEPFGFDRGSLDHFTNTEVEGLSGLETWWELLGGLSGFKAGAGAVKAGGNPELVKVFSDLVKDYRQVAKEQGTKKFWDWKKPDQPAPKPKEDVPIDEQMAEKGKRFFHSTIDVSRSTTGKAARLLGGAGAGAAIFGGAFTTPDRDERGNLKTKEQVYEDARFRSMMAEVIRTASVAGMHKLGTMIHSRIEKKVIANLEELAGQGNVEAKAYLEEIRGGKIDIVEWLKDHGTGDMIEDFNKADQAAQRLGGNFSVMHHLGQIGAKIAETLVKMNPARARKRLRETIEADQRELRRVTDEVNQRLAAGRPDLLGEAPPITGRTAHEVGKQRKPMDEEGEAYGRFIDSTRKTYRERIGEFSKEYEQLNQTGKTVMINTDGLDIPNVTQNLLIQAESVHSLVEPKLWQSVRKIAELAKQAREQGIPFQMTATDAHEIIRLNNSVKRALGTRYAEKYQVNEASKKLRQRIFSASRELGIGWQTLDRRYNAEIARTYRGGLGIGRRAPEKIVMEDKYDWYRVKKDLFGKGENKIDEVAFFDLDKAGNSDELADAIVATARGGLLDEAGRVDFRKFHSFLEKNKAVVNPGSPTGRRIIDGLVGEVNDALARQLGRTEGKVIDDDLISAAVGDPAMMRNLMRVAEHGKESARTGHRGIDPQTLKWAVVQKLWSKDKPADDMAQNAQSYEELFSDDLEHLQQVRDIAEMTQRLKHFESLRDVYLANPKGLLVGEDSWRARLQTAAMASFGAKVETIVANAKMVLGIRTQGHAYGAAHLGSLYMGVTEVQRVLDMMTGAAATKEGANMVHKLMTPMDPKGEHGKVFNRRFINGVYQYLKPYFYEFEAGQYPSTESEDRADAIDATLQDARLRGGR